MIPVCMRRVLGSLSRVCECRCFSASNRFGHVSSPVLVFAEKVCRLSPYVPPSLVGCLAVRAPRECSVLTYEGGKVGWRGARRPCAPDPCPPHKCGGGARSAVCPPSGEQSGSSLTPRSLFLLLLLLLSVASSGSSSSSSGSSGGGGGISSWHNRSR